MAVPVFQPNQALLQPVERTNPAMNMPSSSIVLQEEYPFFTQWWKSLLKCLIKWNNIYCNTINNNFPDTTNIQSRLLFMVGISWNISVSLEIRDVWVVALWRLLRSSRGISFWPSFRWTRITSLSRLIIESWAKH